MADDIISGLQDLRDLSWTRYRHSSGTAGSFLKSESVCGGEKIYYKLSGFDPFHGITGHECVNELIADRLLTILGAEHLHYKLIHALIRIEDMEYTTWLCSSVSFRRPGESKLALDVYYQLKRNAGETPLAFCIRSGWSDYIYRMLLVDFLLLNRDRHGANMEVLRDRKTRTVRPAPLFDQGLSLFFSCRNDEEIARTDVMEDKPVQCFVGSHSAKDNLTLIPADHRPAVRPLQSSDRTFLLQGLDQIQSDVFCNKVWEMISKRWEYYENLCHKG